MRKYKIVHIIQRFYLFSYLFLLSSLKLFAQDEGDSDDEQSQFERYAHLGLSKGEIISIVIGILLILIAINFNLRSKILVKIVFGLGIICLLPLLAVILAVGQKVVAYGLILAFIIGALYFIFTIRKDKS